MASRASTAIEKLIGRSSVISSHQSVTSRVQVLLTGLDSDYFAVIVMLEDSKMDAFHKEAAFIAARQAGLVYFSSAGIGKVCDKLMD